MEKYKKLKLLKFFLRYASELSIAPKAQNVSFLFFTLNSLKDTLSTIDCSELCLNSLYNWMVSNTLCSFCLWKEGSLDDSEEWWHQKTEENIYITCDALYKKRNDKRLYNTCICYAKSLQLCLTLCDPIDGSPPGFPVPGILQARTGVGCHFHLQCMKVKSESEVAQSCLTLNDPMDCSLPGSSIHGIFQARVLEWGAIAFSEYLHSSPKRDSREHCLC